MRVYQLEQMTHPLISFELLKVLSQFEKFFLPHHFFSGKYTLVVYSSIIYTYTYSYEGIWNNYDTFTNFNWISFFFFFENVSTNLFNFFCWLLISTTYRCKYQVFTYTIFFPLHFFMGVFIKLVTCSNFNLISCLQFFLSCPLIFFELVSVSLEFCDLSHPLNKICTTPSKYCAVCLSQFALRTDRSTNPSDFWCVLIFGQVCGVCEGTEFWTIETQTTNK